VIEFSCPNCQKVLKTSDEKAGVQAKCPGCGEVVNVPLATAEPAGDIATFDSGADETPDEMQTCPMCGQQIKAAAVKCRYCGETVGVLPGEVGRREIVPTTIEVGDIVSRSWEFYKKEFGLCLGSCLIFFVVLMVANFAMSIVFGVLQFGAMAAVGGMNPGAGGGGGGMPPEMIGILVVFTALRMVAQMLIQVYLQLGLTMFLLRLIRGERPEITDIFRGGRFLWRGLGANILMTLMVLLGFLALIIPGIIVALMLSPFMYYLVDQNCGAIDSLKGAARITKGNLLAQFVLGLVGAGIMLLGILALCIGSIFAMPLIMVMQSFVYLGMAGQLAPRKTA
jgi:phage FluMu protein Com